MTDLVTPGGIDTEIDNLSMAAAVEHGGASRGFISPSGSPFIAQHYAALNDAALDAFSESSSAVSLDVDVSPGEAFVGGAWVARDVATTVTLAASTAGQLVQLGWKSDSVESDEVVVALSDDAVWDAEYPRIDLWTFDTDATGVTAATDERNVDDWRVANGDVQALVNVGSSAFSQYPLANSDLTNSQVTVAGNPVGLGGATSVDLADLAGRDHSALQNVQSDQHHTRYTDAEAAAAAPVQSVNSRTGTIVSNYPQYGTGEDGTITRSSNTSEAGFVNAVNYTVNGGVTVTPSETFLVILAQESITVNGTINAIGAAGNGGAGGSSGFGNGSDGGDGLAYPQSLGGDGSTTTNGRGGDGGDGDVGSPTIEDVAAGGFGTMFRHVRETPELLCGAGGGGGGGGDSSNITSPYDGGDGSPPGGGGSGFVNDSGSDGSSGPGGDGGSGGGLVVLAAPEITITGAVRADGEDGDPGVLNGGGGGGGGGGSGGMIFVHATYLDDSSATYSVSAGAGGAGASKSDADAGDGAAGVSGGVFTFTV